MNSIPAKTNEGELTSISIEKKALHREFLSYSIRKLIILEQVTSISNPPEVMLNRKVIKKCHSTIAIDRTFTIALPEWNGSSLISPNPCAFKNKPI